MCPKLDLLPTFRFTVWGLSWYVVNFLLVLASYFVKGIKAFMGSSERLDWTSGCIDMHVYHSQPLRVQPKMAPLSRSVAPTWQYSYMSLFVVPQRFAKIKLEFFWFCLNCSHFLFFRYIVNFLWGKIHLYTVWVCLQGTQRNLIDHQDCLIVTAKQSPARALPAGAPYSGWLYESRVTTCREKGWPIFGKNEKCYGSRVTTCRTKGWPIPRRNMKNVSSPQQWGRGQCQAVRGEAPEVYHLIKILDWSRYIWQGSLCISGKTQWKGNR